MFGTCAGGALEIGPNLLALLLAVVAAMGASFAAFQVRLGARDRNGIGGITSGRPSSDKNTKTT